MVHFPAHQFSGPILLGSSAVEPFKEFWLLYFAILKFPFDFPSGLLIFLFFFILPFPPFSISFRCVHDWSLKHAIMAALTLLSGSSNLSVILPLALIAYLSSFSFSSPGSCMTNRLPRKHGHFCLIEIFCLGCFLFYLFIF